MRSWAWHPEPFAEFHSEERPFVEFGETDASGGGVTYRVECRGDARGDASGSSLTVELWDFDFDVLYPDGIDLILAIGGIATGLIAVAVDPVYRSLAAVSFIFSGLAIVEDFFGFPS